MQFSLFILARDVQKFYHQYEADVLHLVQEKGEEGEEGEEEEEVEEEGWRW